MEAEIIEQYVGRGEYDFPSAHNRPPLVEVQKCTMT